MKLIVGLGNPGRIYSGSRHNAGALLIKALAKKHKISLKKDRETFSLSGSGKIEKRHAAVLAVPLVFMNLSGRAVAALIKKYKLHLQDILIVCDDLDLGLGRIKIRGSGSSGGHRGLKSIMDALRAQGFARLRIGIGRPPHQLLHKNLTEDNWCGGRPRPSDDVSDYVLSGFDQADEERLQGSLKNAVGCCEYWVAEGTTKSMNMFNRRSN